MVKFQKFQNDILKNEIIKYMKEGMKTIDIIKKIKINKSKFYRLMQDGGTSNNNEIIDISENVIIDTSDNVIIENSDNVIIEKDNFNLLTEINNKLSNIQLLNESNFEKNNNLLNEIYNKLFNKIEYDNTILYNIYNEILIKH